METAQSFSKEILKIPLLKGLEADPKALQEIVKLFKLERFQSRQFIINETQGSDRLFFLVSGEVEINKIDDKGQVIVLGRTSATQAPFFGEGALLGKAYKSANVLAYSNCECLSLSAADLDAFIRRSPFAGAIIYRNMAGQLFDRLTKADRDLLILGVS